MNLGNKLSVGEIADLAPVDELAVEAPTGSQARPVQAETPAEPVVAHADR